MPRKNMYIWLRLHAGQLLVSRTGGYAATDIGGTAEHPVANPQRRYPPDVFCTSGDLGQEGILIFFTIGIIAAAFGSADSALTALTTSFCVDILGVQERKKRAKRTRLKVHVMISVLFVLIILAFKAVNNRSVIDAIS